MQFTNIIVKNNQFDFLSLNHTLEPIMTICNAE